MKHKPIINTFAFLFAFCLVALIHAQDQDTYDLQPHWKQGQESRYEFWNQRNQTITISMAGNSNDITRGYTSEGEIIWRVKTIKADGSAICELKIDFITITLVAPDKSETVIDSRKSAPEPYKRFSDALTAIASSWLTFDVAPNGEVRSVKGVKQLQSKVQDPEDVPEALDFIESASDLATLVGPPPALQIGGSWKQKFRWTFDPSIPFPGFNKIKSHINYNTTYTLDSVEDVESIPLATITGTATMKLDIDKSSIPKEVPPVTFKLSNNQFNTQILYDLQRSEAVGRHTEQQNTVTANIATPRGNLQCQVLLQQKSQVLRLAETN
ncbi:hypothetical protein [Poriferisphaera sp. WC338]|uniref:hypothetical protein n=1 Tax=Poriferisphaera sp. WC338 TaxID=3425129 RepID=UPI003D818243